MSIYKRGSIWWYKVKFNGQTIRQSTGQTQKRKAEEIERRVRQQLADDKFANATGRPRPTLFGEAMVRWLKTSAPKSMLSHANNVRPYLEDVLLDDVPLATSNMVRDMLARGLKKNTVNRRIAVVKRILNLSFSEWKFIDQPLDKRISKYDEAEFQREYFLTRDQVTDLVSQIESDEIKRITLLAVYTGLRRGELLSLQPSNWKPPYIVLTSKTKSKKPRTIPVVEELHALVDLPFNVTGHELRVAWESARDAVGHPEWRFHDLRHSFASWLAEDPQIPLTVIRDLLGHSSLAVTNKYAHLRGAHIDLVQNALGEKRGTKRGTVH